MLKLFPPRPFEKKPNWQIRGSYLGVSIDQSAKTGKRALAQKVLRQIEQEIECGRFSPPSAPTFASAAEQYMLGGGERTYVRPLLDYFGTKRLSDIDQAVVDAAAIAIYPRATNATRNRQVHTPVSAIFRAAGINLSLRRPKGSAGARRTDWFWPEQAEALFEAAKELDQTFAALLIVLCYTGLRLSEALGLTWERVRLQDGYAYIPDTKNGEPRAVFLPAVAVAALGNLDKSGGARVFRFAKGGHLYSLLRAAAARASVDLPEREAFHIFRHTYGTWMRRYAGLDTKGLVATGAWKDTKSADRYSHTIVTEEARRAELLPTGRKVS